MSSTAQFLLIFVGIPALLLAAVALVAGVEWAAANVESAAARYHQTLEGWRMRKAKTSFVKQDREQFLGWLAQRAHVDLSSAAIDEQLVAAQQQSELIRVLVEHEIPKAVCRCVDTHRLMAHAT